MSYIAIRNMRIFSPTACRCICLYYGNRSTKLKINCTFGRLRASNDRDSSNLATIQKKWACTQQLDDAVMEKKVVLGRFQDEFYRINMENIMHIICNHSPINEPDYHNNENVSFQPTSFSASINPKYYQYGLGALGRLKITHSQGSQFSYQIQDSKEEEVIVDGNVTKANQDLKSHNPETYHSHQITVRPSDISNKKQVYLPQFLCYAMGAIKDAIASKFNDSYIMQMDKTWYSKAIHFRLDCHLPAYVNEMLTIKSWANATLDQINCQIFRDDDCLSTFSITFNPDIKYIPKLLPLQLDVIENKFTYIDFNAEHLLSFRDRFNQLNVPKYLFIFVEAFATVLRYGTGNIFKLVAGTKGSVVAVSNRITYNPIFFTMDPKTPLKLSAELSSIGKKSFISILKVIDHKTQTVMSETKNITVLFKDGKPKVIPDTFRNELLEHIPLNQSTEKSKHLFEKIPRDHYEYPVKVRYGDLDLNNHVGISMIIGYCLDAATSVASSKSSAYKLDFGKDFNPSCIREKNLIYFGQLFAGDDAVIDTWQEYGTNSLFFNIRKGNEIKSQVTFVIDPLLICRSS